MCKALENIDRNCGFVLGGIREISVVEYKDDLNYIINDNGLIINEILPFQLLKIDPFTGSFTYSIENTINGFLGSVTVNGVFEKIEPIKYKKLLRLLSKKMFILVRDMNGLNWFIGLDSGVKVKNMTMNTATKGGYNGFNLTLVSTSSIMTNVSPIVFGGEFDGGAFNDDFNNKIV